MDENVKSYIKPGIFIKESNLNDYNSSYRGLHPDESQSLSFTRDNNEENISTSDKKKSKDSFNSSSISSSINTATEKKESKNSEEILFTFIWDEGGTNVKITGSFVNWSKTFDMIYYPEEKVYKYSHNLSKGKHSYKFIIDGIWKYSQKQPIIKDNSNNINNFIDLTNYKPPEKTKQEKIVVKKKQKSNKKKKNKGYDIKFPRKDDLNIEAPVVKEDYFETFLINSHTNQNFIGRSQHLKYETRESFSEEKSYKKLMFAPHIIINHSLKSVNKSDLLETGMSFRFRDKNCTLIYYSHHSK